MIVQFADEDTAKVFRGEPCRRLAAIYTSARRRLLQLHSAQQLGDLRAPPGNRLEALRGERKGQHSIRINDQWRLCFCWNGHDARNVEIVDYH